MESQKSWIQQYGQQLSSESRDNKNQLEQLERRHTEKLEAMQSIFQDQILRLEKELEAFHAREKEKPELKSVGSQTKFQELDSYRWY